MKKLTFLFVAILFGTAIFAQSPQKMSYQAVIRDAMGQLVSNQLVGIRLSILQGSVTGSNVYQETQTPTTNANGLVTVEFGGGTGFNAINWGNGPFFIKTETDPAGGTNYTISGTSQLLSVPYAFLTKLAEGVADNSITSAKIVDGAVGNADLAVNAVAGNRIQDGSVTGSDLADNCIGTSKIIDGTVSTVDLADNSIISSKIADNSLTTSDLADNAVTTLKIANGAVTGAKIAQAGAASGQALKWNGTTWAPADDAAGPGFTLPVDLTVNATDAAFKITNTNWDTSGAIHGASNSFTGYGVLGTSPITGVYGEASNTSGVGYGVQGMSHSTSGAGIYGTVLSVTGNTSGVFGTVNSASGSGVYGLATLISGTNYGIKGVSQSASGYGMYGESPNYGILGKATNTTNYNYGVRGESGSVQGVGVYGEASSATGPTCGLIGRSVSSDGKGILGYGYSSSGTNYGVYGYSNSPSGYGIYGYSPNFGVYGEATASNNSANAGVTGKTASAYGYGVYGVASSTTGANYGVRGVSFSGTGYGVLGEAPGTGVRGTATASNGFGVVGYASSTTGSTAGVYAQVNSAGGFSGYFTGGKFYVNGRTGIGTESPSAGLHLKGSGFPGSFMYLEANTGSDAGFRLYEGTTDKWHIFNNAVAGGLQIYNNGGVTALFCRQDNSNVGIGTTTPGYKLQVGNLGDGTQARANAWNALSDVRLKKDLRGLKNPLDLVGKINGYYFYWNTGMDQTRQVGFSAQEVQKVIPEIVSKGEDGYLSIEYGKMTPLLVEAIKELKAENELLRERLERIEEEMQRARGTGYSVIGNQ